MGGGESCEDAECRFLFAWIHPNRHPSVGLGVGPIFSSIGSQLIYKRLSLTDGAQERTRTSTAFTTGAGNQRVYQFRHLGLACLLRVGVISCQCARRGFPKSVTLAPRARSQPRPPTLSRRRMNQAGTTITAPAIA